MVPVVGTGFPGLTNKSLGTVNVNVNVFPERFPERFPEMDENIMLF